MTQTAQHTPERFGEDPYDVAIMREADSIEILRIIQDDVDLSDLYKLMGKSTQTPVAEYTGAKECILQIHKRLIAATELLAICQRLIEDAGRFKGVQYEAASFALLNATVAKATGAP